MFDTHCHLTFPDLHEQVEDVLQRASTKGVRGAITVATGSHDAPACLELANRFPQVWCTSGIHPHQALEPADWNTIGTIAKEPKCVAWGELGLDWHYPDPPREAQITCLQSHLDLIEQAREQGIEKPIVVHCRKSLPGKLLVILRPPCRTIFRSK